MISLSMSRLEYAEACPGFVALSQAPYEPGKPAKVGTAIHSYLVAVAAALEAARGSYDEARAMALSKVDPEFKDACSAIPLENLPLDTGAYSYEVAWAYDVATDTAREIGRDIGRDYGPIKPTEIPGSADIVALFQDRTGLVVDIKTGREPPIAKESLQLRAYALCLSRIYRLHSVNVAILHVPAYDTDKEPRWDHHTLDVMDLDSVGVRLMRIWEQTANAADAVRDGESIKLQQGSYCRYCPAFNACPAKQELIRAWRSNAELKDLVGAEALDDAGAVRLYQWVKSAGELVARMETLLTEYAWRNPIALPDGRVYGPRPLVRTRLGDPSSIVAEKYGEEAVRAVRGEMDVTISREGLKRALRPFIAKNGDKITNTIDEIIARMKETQSATVSVTETISTYKPKEVTNE